VDSKLQEKKRKFSSKQIEKQFDVVCGFKELCLKTKSALEEKEYKHAATANDILLEQIETQEENLIIADSSPHSWLAVAKVRAATDLPKNLRKKLEIVNKELSAKPQHGAARRKPPQLQREGQNPLMGGSSPEEAIFLATRNAKPGTCTLCKKELHFYKECPLFWEKVTEARIATKTKEPGGN